LQKEINKVEEKTKNYNKFTLNFAMAYGGREEIIDAINKIIKEKKQSINEKDFPKYLYTKSEPDIIIRTGDVSRTSNFFPWQAVYSEWFFLKKMWPEITKEDIKNIINDFHIRERRFGK
jgi:undecaprenyl diphosphate synthase